MQITATVDRHFNVRGVLLFTLLAAATAIVLGVAGMSIPSTPAGAGLARSVSLGAAPESLVAHDRSEQSFGTVVQECNPNNKSCLRTILGD